MKAKVKRRLIGVSIVIVAAVVALNVVAYRHAYAMMHFSNGRARTKEPEALTIWQKIRVLICGVNIPRPQSNLSPGELAPQCEAVTIESTNRIRLGAWYCPGAKSNSVVILFHGYSGDKTGTLAEARAFLALGHAVLLVDFRGSGESSEAYTTVGFAEAEDVAAAFLYARSRAPQARIILYGQSMGAAAVLRAVYACGVRPDAILVEAVFDKMLNTVRHRFQAMGVPSFPAAELLLFWGGHQAGFNGFDHNPIRYAAGVKCPILFLHGTADPRARIEEARRVFAAVPGAKRFTEFPGLAHEGALHRFPEEWKNSVRPFLEQIQTTSE